MPTAGFPDYGLRTAVTRSHEVDTVVGLEVRSVTYYEPETCTDETHIHGCPGAAGGDHIVAKSYCRCRKTRTETQEYMTGKCSLCHTFARDHAWYGDESSDFRCYDCDGRQHSHGGPQS